MSIQDFLSEDPLNVTDDDIGEFLLNVITRGLYIEPHIILREYIQNSHDAIVTWNNTSEVGRIDIKLEPPDIHIIDNGPGMNRDDLIAAMRKVGISSKPVGSASGFMGIGKLAGLSMAEKVYITSSKYGVPEKNRVVFYGEEMQQAIDERRMRGDSQPIAQTLKSHSHLNRIPMPESSDAHYTSIHLLGVDEEYWKAINNREEFIKKLGLVAPVKQNLQFMPHASLIESFLETIAPEHYFPLEVYVDDVPLYRPWFGDLQRPREIEVLDETGNQIAYGWVCQHKESQQIPDPLMRGIALLQRGIAIGERGLAEDLGLYGSNPLYFRWHMGEIYITNPRILLTANRMSMRRDEQANDFLQRVKQELRKVSRAAAEFSQRDNAAKKAPEDVRVIQQSEQKVLNRSLNKELVPSTVKQLVTARQDLQKRSRFIPSEIQADVSAAIQTADKLIVELTTPTPRADELPPFLENIFTPASPSESSDATEEDITVLEEENKGFFSIADRLGFSQKERLIFQTILEAIAEVCGGWDTKDFVKYIEKIEEFLNMKFQQAK